jgi:hypothetical protein
MSGIRALERGDLSELATLTAVASGWTFRPPGLPGYYERTLLDGPWVDAEIPSLVYEDDDGSIAAFQGSLARHGRFDGRPIRIACGVNLVSRPDARRRGLGAILTRAYLAGPQDLTITDRATDQMREIWTLLGGQIAHLGCVDWIRVFRPSTLAAGRIARRPLDPSRPVGKLSAALAVASPFTSRMCSGLDVAAARVGPWFSEPPEPQGTSEELTPESMLEHLPLVADQVRLHVAYDPPFLTWLFTELAAVRERGSLVAKLVRGRGGGVLGWYIYYLKPEGVSHVVQVASSGRDSRVVVDHLFRDAWLGGAAALRGRVEARLLEPVGGRRCFLRYVGGSLVHSRDPAILGVVAAGDSLLTRLDSEWWMGNDLALTGPP